MLRTLAGGSGFNWLTIEAGKCGDEPSGLGAME
jgi:hypothetical protein